MLPSTVLSICLRAGGQFPPRPPMGPPPTHPYRAPRVQYWKDGESTALRSVRPALVLLVIWLVLTFTDKRCWLRCSVVAVHILWQLRQTTIIQQVHYLSTIWHMSLARTCLRHLFCQDLHHQGQKILSLSSFWACIFCKELWSSQDGTSKIGICRGYCLPNSLHLYRWDKPFDRVCSGLQL